jgi:hypothetical protein
MTADDIGISGKEIQEKPDIEKESGFGRNLRRHRPRVQTGIVHGPKIIRIFFAVGQIVHFMVHGQSFYQIITANPFAGVERIGEFFVKYKYIHLA